jgi:hypothetical protein
VLSLRRHGFFAFQMLSHKVLRYAVAALLPVVFLSNLFLLNQSVVYQGAMAAQITFYLSALAAWIPARFGAAIGPLALPYYFVLAQAAILVAFVKFIRGEAHVVWEPLREPTRSNADIESGRAGSGNPIPQRSTN